VRDVTAPAAATPSDSPRGLIVSGGGKPGRKAVADVSALARWRAASEAPTIRLAPTYSFASLGALTLSMRTNEPVCGASIMYPLST
jgi:hypothetical protein